MSNPQFTPYVDALTDSMSMLMEDPDTIFVGQQIVYYGNPMSKTIEGLPKWRMIETPVMEETQMGMSLGLAMAGYRVVSFYPRWDFLICAMNQLVNHVDKIRLMSDDEWKPRLIIRVGKGSDKPLDPGYQHKGNYTEQVKRMLVDTPVINLNSYNKIRDGYEMAMNHDGPIIMVEYPELYYES